MIIFLTFIVLLAVWVVYVKHSVAEKKEKTLKSFKALDKLLQKRYNSIHLMLNTIKNSEGNEQFDLEYTEKLMSEIMSLGTKEKNIDRRIAYDIELAKDTENIISILNGNSNDEIKTIIDGYNALATPIKNAIVQYNSDAKVLRYAVDKFPSSFIARLSKIKYFDTI